ncbi:Ubiquitin-conjugating enzyme E2 6 [Mucor velutinosus]|uniref:Ubiquitin-conjugating enzyme E2 6 n=1 Tax=Mucor velutinosus TaxID=708070 RepID=A0AAN7HYW7_9FUNG|nr:Ubiquitin-conjugating enzyme E2 6 [Mucor velutinosus]
MTKSYAFYDVVDKHGTWHVQCEWFNETVDLEQETGVQYGIITITNLQDYWQHTIDRDVLLQSFPVSNALIKEQRNNVLTAAFLSVESLNGSKLEWKISLQEHGELQMRLRTFDGDIPLTAGSFLLKKAPQDTYQHLHKLWFTNTATASCASTEVNKALQQRITDITKTNKELKETIESLIIKENKNKFVMIDKFVRLLNRKKQKNFSLEHHIKKQDETNKKLEKTIKKLTEENKELKKRKRDEREDDMEVHMVSQRITKQQRIVKEETRSLPLPAVVHDEEDGSSDYYGSDDDIDCPQTVR